MKTKNYFSFQILTKLSLTLALGLVVSLLSSLGKVSFAQIDLSEEQDPFPKNEQDSLYRGSFNPWDIIHRANLGNGRSAEEFYQDSNENLNNAVDDYKRLQMERIKNQNQVKPIESSPNETETSQDLEIE